MNREPSRNDDMPANIIQTNKNRFFDDYLKFENNLSIYLSSFAQNNQRLRFLLIFLEYSFHGVPWFLIVISMYIFADISYSKQIFILSLG
jgi:hypothetical protein